MVSWAYALLAIISALTWYLDPNVCIKKLCTLTLLGRSLFLWGALMYSLFGLLSALPGKSMIKKYILFAGAGAHSVLLIYWYIASREICSTCLMFNITEYVIALSYIHLGLPEKIKNQIIGSMGVLVVMAFLVINPSIVPKNNIAEKHISVGTIKVMQGDNIFTLDPNIKPVVYVAWFCPHCDTVLGVIKELPETQRPHVVAAYSHTKEDVEKNREKLHRFGLPELINLEGPQLDGVPVLLQENSKLLMGEQNIIDYLVKKKG